MLRNKIGKVRILVCLFYFHSIYLWAQNFPSENWYPGKIVFSTFGDLDSLGEVVGNIQYDFDNDAVRLNVGNTIKVYPAANFVYTEIYIDDTTQRLFYSLPYPKKSTYEIPTVFELLTAGKSVSLLCREKIVTELTSDYDFLFGRTFFYNRTRLQYAFYFFYVSGKIKPCCVDKNELFQLLKDKAEILKNYVKEQRIDFSSKDDLISLINYYNSLK